MNLINPDFVIVAAKLFKFQLFVKFYFDKMESEPMASSTNTLSGKNTWPCKKYKKRENPNKIFTK